MHCYFYGKLSMHVLDVNNPYSIVNILSIQLENGKINIYNGNFSLKSLHKTLVLQQTYPNSKLWKFITDFPSCEFIIIICEVEWIVIITEAGRFRVDDKVI